MTLSYRNQSIDLRSKSMDWFLYDDGLRLERVKNFADFQTNNIVLMIAIKSQNFLIVETINNINSFMTEAVIK